ncbi:MAG: class I SAM-dependent methyltransferase [Bryobacteraceae bacterium]
MGSLKLLLEKLRRILIAERPTQKSSSFGSPGSCAHLTNREERQLFRIDLDYAIHPVPRWGYGRPRHAGISQILEGGRASYGGRLNDILANADYLRAIPLEEDPARPYEPFWRNGFLPGLDVAALYSFIRQSNGARYVEIGCGNSTRVVRRAIRDHQLRTSVISIDPEPRAEIDAICDHLIRKPLEYADLSVFDKLGAGDIVFFDGSHRVFMNSDVTVFFLDVLPRLRPGVLVQIHDIFWPDDYPEAWTSRCYSEQYMLACYLLAQPHFLEVILPNNFAFTDPALSELVAELWRRVALPGIEPQGGSFWLRVRSH